MQRFLYGYEQKKEYKNNFLEQVFKYKFDNRIMPNRKRQNDSYSSKYRFNLIDLVKSM